MLHAVESNEGACAPQSGLAMDGDTAFFLFGRLQEFLDDVVWRGGTIQEVQVEVFDARLDKLLLFVLGLIEANDERYAELLENGNIVIRSERAVLVGHILGARKGDELTRDDPIKVSVLNFFVVLILLDVEC